MLSRVLCSAPFLVTGQLISRLGFYLAGLLAPPPPGYTLDPDTLQPGSCLCGKAGEHEAVVGSPQPGRDTETTVSVIWCSTMGDVGEKY